MATFDDSGIFPEQSLYFLFNNRSGNISFKYLLGILNSSFVTFYYRAILVTNKQSIAQLKKIHLDVIPIRTIKFSDSADKARHDQMLSLHKQLAKAKVNHVKTTIQRQIESTDQQINGLVYELYGLAKEEIEIVEEGMQ